MSGTDVDSEEDMLARLKFIGQIRRGEKISVKDKQVQPDTYITSFHRTFISPESRDDTFNFINKSIKDAFELLKKYGDCKNSFDKVMTTHILNDLEAAKSGLQNIKATYNTDIMFSCKIDTVLQEIEARLAYFNEKVFTEKNDKAEKIGEKIEKLEDNTYLYPDDKKKFYRKN